MAREILHDARLSTTLILDSGLEYPRWLDAQGLEGAKLSSSAAERY
jgi:hypothetical protein